MFKLKGFRALGLGVSLFGQRKCLRVCAAGPVQKRGFRGSGFKAGVEVFWLNGV